MLITNNILAAPFVLLMYALDVYMISAIVRLIAAQMPGAFAGRLRLGLQGIVDPPFNSVSRRLAVWRQTHTPAWIVWLIVLGLVFVLRHLIFFILVAVH